MHTRRQILFAAELEFADRGMAHTTLADIAQRAGVTRGAIYWHFRSKEGLYQEILDNLRAPLDALIPSSDGGARDPLGNLKKLMVFTLRELEFNPSTRRRHEIILFKSEATDQALGVRQRRQNHAAAFHRQVESVILLAIAQGQLPHSLDASLAAASVQAWLKGHIGLWLLLPGQRSIAASAETLAQAALDMLQNSSLSIVN